MRGARELAAMNYENAVDYGGNWMEAGLTAKGRRSKGDEGSR